MSLPVLSRDEISAEWLTGMLRGKGHDVTIASVELKAIGTGQVGATYRIKLNFEGDPNGFPPTIVAKLPSNDELSRTTGKSHLTYLRESRFYQTFAGKKPMAVPDYLYIAFDEDSHDFTLIMHDLPSHVQGNQLGEPSREEALLAVDAAASIHAAWWGDPMIDTLDWPNGTKAVPPQLDSDMLFGMFWPAFCDRYGDRVDANMRTVGEAFLGKLNANYDTRQSPRCLTHNDFRPDNMLFNVDDPAKPIVIVDWQTTGVGIGVGDIAYYTGTAFEAGHRRDIERELLARYRTQLIARGVPEGDLAHIEDDYCRSAVAGFLMGVTAAMVVERTDRGDDMFLAMARRSSAMVLDHGDRALPQ
ncbi:MAG: phosphotransferase [Sphingorhabdus sp.]|uniref:phosphotransferase family protein n=1 Tax=Sphingorhabdus sp. TaxID=1902408 RepID=UPI003C87BA05